MSDRQRGGGGGGYSGGGGGGGYSGGGGGYSGGGSGGGGGGQRRGRRKVCSFCVDKLTDIDYKDIPRLRRYLSDRAKIIPRRVTGTCAHHQRQLTLAIKRARHVALLPFVSD